MKLRIVPARHGVLWVRSGFRIFFRRPFAYAALFALFMFGASALMQLPGIGVLLVLVVLPLVTQVFMLATQRALLDRPMLPTLYAEPLRAGRPQALAMLGVGLAYAAATAAILWIGGIADAGKFDAFEEAMVKGAAQDPKQVELLLQDPQLLFGVLLRLGLASLLSVPFWHAPPLVHWGAQSWPKSLFFSTVACWRNRAAFAAYALTWVTVVLLFGIFANVLFAALGQPALIGLAALPAGLMFSTVFYASLYFSFADCFEYRLDPQQLPPKTP